jgi:hypothetical protein
VTSEGLPHRIRNSEDPIRFFFDESCLGIGKIVAQARTDAIYPGHPRSPITPGDLDADWIPVAAVPRLAFHRPRGIVNNVTLVHLEPTFPKPMPRDSLVIRWSHSHCHCIMEHETGERPARIARRVGLSDSEDEDGSLAADAQMRR